jgi:hypothetical protein
MDEITDTSLPTLPTCPSDVVIIAEKDYEPTILTAPSQAIPLSQDLPCCSGENITLLPRSALSALSLPSINQAKTIEIAIALANTVQENRKDFAHQTQLYAQAYQPPPRRGSHPCRSPEGAPIRLCPE